MKHAVYASIMRQPYELVEYFSQRSQAKKMKRSIDTFGVKRHGVMCPATAKIVIKNL